MPHTPRDPDSQSRAWGLTPQADTSCPAIMVGNDPLWAWDLRIPLRGGPAAPWQGFWPRRWLRNVMMSPTIWWPKWEAETCELSTRPPLDVLSNEEGGSHLRRNLGSLPNPPLSTGTTEISIQAARGPARPHTLAPASWCSALPFTLCRWAWEPQGREAVTPCWPGVRLPTPAPNSSSSSPTAASHPRGFWVPAGNP